MSIYKSDTLIAGRYRVAGKPLMGGMGIVYLCEDMQEDRPVALKTFRPEFLRDRAARDRFLLEGTTWVELGRHPHIVRAYRVERIGDGREVYLVLELVAKEPGREDASLRSWLLPGQPLGVEQALLFGLQIARGMAHASSTIDGLVHRDLKPENVLVGADRLANADSNRLRITDFGLVGVLQDSGIQASEVSETLEVSTNLGRAQLTGVSTVGTPLYMAPEQWQGTGVSQQTDMYALGCMLYEMLAGQRVVAGHSLGTLKRAHCEGALRPLPGDLPGAVAELLLRCLAVEPGARYADWGALELALAGAYAEVAGRTAPEPETAQALEREERVAAGWSYNAIGVSYRDLGKAEVAVGYFQRVLGAGRKEERRQLEAAGLGNLGLAYSDLGQVERAIECYEAALAISREIGDRSGEGAGLGNLGTAYHPLGQVERAIEYYEAALAISREIGDRHGEGNSLGNLGYAYSHLGQVERAIENYEPALAIAREIGDRRGEGAVLCNLGLAYSDLGQVERAIEYYESALAVAREIGDRRVEANVVGNLGSAYLALGQVERAIEYQQQGLITSREIGDRRSEGADLGNLGTAYYSLGQVERAIEYHQQGLIISREIGDRRSEGQMLGNLGIAHSDLGRVERAIEYYEPALAIAREIGDRHNEGNWLGSLGNAYYSLGQVERAIECYEPALAISREIRDRRGERNRLGNLGLAYSALGQGERAIEYHQQTLIISREIGDRQGEGNHLSYLGNAYRDLGQVERAIEHYEPALAISREIGDGMGVAGHSFNIALLLVQQGQAERALPLAKQAAQIFEQIGSPNAQEAQGLVAQLQGGETAGTGPDGAQILRQLGPVIAAVVAASRGDTAARQGVEELFDTLTRDNWRIVEPIQRIWAGERDGATLTAGLDEADTLIVRQILRQLEG